eukprot:3456210-Prymnesium_polylepis.1
MVAFPSFIFSQVPRRCAPSPRRKSRPQPTREADPAAPAISTSKPAASGSTSKSVLATPNPVQTPAQPPAQPPPHQTPRHSTEH